jgi:hypothetical protein
MSFMQRMFGPSKEEIWQQLCAKIDGEYVEGGFWKGGKVQARHGDWTVTLDTYTVSTGKSHVTYTRMRAPYANPGGFQFTIYRKGIFSDLGKWLGMQDVQVGHEPFDSEFIIKGNSEAKLVELFAHRPLRELISAQPEIKLTVKDDEGWFGADFPEGVDELSFTCLGVIKDVDRLERLYHLFAETLDQLCRIGGALKTPVDVKL